MRILLRLFVSALIAFPITILSTFLLTPVYWRLEPVLGIELAGHSGPSDWVFELNLVILTAAIFLLFQIIFRRRESKLAHTDSSHHSE